MGDFDPLAAQAATVELARRWPGDPIRAAFVDLRQLTDCSVDARAALLAMHGVLRQRTERRVYVASSPRYRGVALWLLHVTGDDEGKVVATDEQAHAWLLGGAKRLEDAERGMLAYLDWRGGV